MKKRYGYRPLFSFDSPIRAIWTGKLDGIFKGYALVGDKVLRLDFQNATYTDIDTVTTSNGKGEFFYYRGRLYLIDGSNIYIVTDDCLRYPFGYVPLVGKDWTESSIGEPYESKNLLNDHARISYVISGDGSAYLRTDDDILHVDSVLLNGEKLSEDLYSVSTLPRTVVVNGLKKGDRIVVCYTYIREPQAAYELLSCKSATVFGAINNSRPFIWNGNDRSVMFNAAYVSIESLLASRASLEDSDELYFPFAHEFSVGDGRYPISAVSRHYDRLLIFTEGGAWMADSSACGTEEFPVMRINSSIGVTSEDAAAMVANEPCTVGASAIYRWTSNTDELDECNAYSISGAIDSLLPQGFFNDAFVYYDDVKGEILISSASLDHKVLVYNTQAKCWCVFEGINAERFIDCGSDVGFIKSSDVFVFDKDCDTDMNIKGEKEIVATFKSNVFDLGTYASKHLCGISAEYSGGAISAELYFDGRSAPESTAILDYHKDYAAEHKRLSSKRFRFARLVLSASGRSAQTIRSLCLYTRQDK